MYDAVLLYQKMKKASKAFEAKRLRIFYLKFYCCDKKAIVNIYIFQIHCVICSYKYEIWKVQAITNMANIKIDILTIYFQRTYLKLYKALNVINPKYSISRCFSQVNCTIC